MELLKVGSELENLSLLDSTGKEVKLLDITKSLTLLYFYPKAMTPGCTTQACCLRDGIKTIEEHRLKIYGISCDAPAKLQKFIARDNLNFPLLSDADHKVCTYFGAWGPKKLAGRDYEGIYRVSFLIQDGKVLANFPKVKPMEHLDMIIKWIDEHR